MADKLLNSLKIQSTISPFMDPSPSKSSAQFNISNTNISSFNPQDESSYLQQNDELFKIINFDNGNAVKDCKALLDTMKEQFLEEKQKLNLFYQPDLQELLQGLKVNDINVKKTIIRKAGQQIESKIRNIKLKKKNEVFNNYSKLMKYSLSENQRIRFIKQSSKITQVRCPSSQSSNIANDLKSSQSILQKIMQQKRNKIAIENSSKINQQWKQLEGIMKNRATCEKILQQALMFERYYHIMKKEKQKVLAEETNVAGQPMDTGLKWRRVKTQTGISNSINKNNVKNLRQSQSFYKRPRALFRNRNNSQSGQNYNSSTSKKSDLFMDPRHLRLPQSVEQRSSSSLNKAHMSQQDYYRSKFIVGLKRDEYLRQINKVNEEIVQKKNLKNNYLISNVLGLIRQNTIGNTSRKEKDSKDDSMGKNKSAMRKQSLSKKQKVEKKEFTNERIRQLSGSQLTKILRRLYLIYSSNNSNNGINKNKTDNQQQTLITLSTSNTQSLSLMSQKCLLKFFSDFQLQQYLQLNNQKIQQILEKDFIDEFQFIQLIHLLSAAIHQTQFNLLDGNQGMIYTNINYWISKRILDKKYSHLLEINEQSLLNKLHKDLIRLRKYFRLEQILNTAIEQFIHAQRVNKLKVKTMFEDFDYVLESLWSMKIYPQFINKNTLKFYFDYLKQEKFNFILNSSAIRIKRKQHVIVQNIVWLVVANMVIKDQRVVDYQHSLNKQISKDKVIEKIFTQKFKLIIISISNTPQSTTTNENNDSNQNNQSIKEEL